MTVLLMWLGWLFAIVGWALVLYFAYRLRVKLEWAEREFDTINAVIAVERQKLRAWLDEEDDEATA